MTDLSTFYTAQTGNGLQNTTSSGRTAESSTNNGTSGGFLDLLFSLLPEQKTTLNSNVQTTSDPQNTLPTDKNIETNTTDLTTDQNDLDQLDDLTLNTMPLPSAPTTPFTDVVKNMTGPNFSSISTEGNTPDPSEITARAITTTQPDLSPQIRAQLAALSTDPALTPLETENIDPKQLNNIVVGGDSSATETIVPIKPLKPDLMATTLETSDSPNQIAAVMNAMNISAGGDPEKSNRTQKSNTLINSLFPTPANDTGYQPALTSTLTGYQGQINNTSIANTPTQTTNNNITSHLTSPTPSSDLSEIDDPLLQFDLSAVDPDRLTPLSNAVTTAANVTVSGITTHGAPSHAAVQAVALHLQQLAQNRDTRSLTLQLNPPELGKLQVKMSFGRDKTVKADILIEKSDTFNLFQKDANALKDALQNAGLQADAGSLNFTLADQGTFTDSGTNNNSNYSGRTSATTDDVLGAIEIKSSEEWSVDPRTGIVRYNIVV